ncbi:hypothetical protein BH09PAT2_BH09PAT2_07420 [soil metagenome]
MTSRKNILAHNICLFILTLLSAVVIFYKFPHVPQNLSYDETEFARLARSLDQTGYMPYSPIATGHATLYFYIILVSMKLFGLTVFGLRFPAAVFGVLGTSIFYLVMRQIFSKEYIHKMIPSAYLEHHDYFMPSLLTFTFLSTRWYFNFARFSFEATFLLFLELVSIYFFLKYKKSLNWKYLIGSGLAAGLAYNSYTPGRLFSLMPLIFIAAEIRSIRNLRFAMFQPLLTFIIPFIIIIAPLTLYFSVHPDIRINQLSYVTNDKMQVGEKIEFGIQNIQKTLLMFHVAGDMNGRHNYPGKPTLNPLIGLFFAVGLVFAIRKIQLFENAFFLFYFVLSLLPMMLTYPWENPNILRSFTAIPAIIFFVGNGVLLIFKLPIKPKILICGLVIIFYAAGAYDLRTYFVYQAYTVFPSAFEIDPLLFPGYVKGMYQWLYQFDKI